MDEKNVIIYKLVPFVEARKNKEGSNQYTTVDIIGNTNQVKTASVMINGKEYLIYTGRI
jgi:hypothetical protein